MLPMPNHAGKGKGAGHAGQNYVEPDFDSFPPLPPAFATMVIHAPPSPPPDENNLTKEIMSAVSMVVGSIMLLGFGLCAFCFISSGGKPGRKPGQAGHSQQTAIDQADTPRACLTSPRGKKGRKDDSMVAVTVDVGAITQTRRLPIDEISSCADWKQLVQFIIDAFPAALKKKRPSELHLFCMAASAPSADAETKWLFVTKFSDVKSVVGTGALKLTEAKGFEERDHPPAFVFKEDARRAKKAVRDASKADGGASRGEAAAANATKDGIAKCEEGAAGFTAEGEDGTDGDDSDDGSAGSADDDGGTTVGAARMDASPLLAPAAARAGGEDSEEDSESSDQAPKTKSRGARIGLPKMGKVAPPQA